MTDTFRSSTSAVGQADIFKKWVQYFGATDPKDLDLGTLTAIHAWVMDGLEPNDQRQERSSAPHVYRWLEVPVP
ncbi:hypothetical protein [Burkholderia contaminans]|uniref:hypothetical protein n=2 Tax=Burkholderiaceae TaxID=119060 RepID=UPI001CF118E6|nr:hypothetical protein [Burkholderia contaminans]MCA8098507.1 hypothetical protein [Burkholderia contaminans]